MARRIRQRSERVEDRAFLDVPARLAKCLLGLARQYGKRQPEGTVAQLKLSQQELGDLIDATRESVNKLLSAWKTDGIVTHEAGRIVFHDVSALEALGAYCADG